ncbi:MAG TPA: molybdopterin-binding oxidoreductase, partial [Micromonosporaceae bacterium]
MRRILYGALAGILAGAAGVALAQLVAAIIRPQSSPLVTVGGTLIDATPTPVKEFAIRQFGTQDKHVLLSSIGLGLIVFAAVVGIVAIRRLRLGMVGAALFGVIGILAAIGRPTFQFLDVMPAVVGGATSVTVLWLLLKDKDQNLAGTAGLDRRRFLTMSGLVAAGAVVVGVGGSLLADARNGSISKLRAALRLPAPADPGPAPERQAGFYTPDTAFYRVDTALTVPQIDPNAWSLRIHGMVDRPMTLSLDQL